MRSRRFSSLRACFSTSSGIFASAIALSSSAISAAPSSPSPSSFWIVRICSRSRCLRCCRRASLCVRSSISRDTFSTSMRCASSSSSLSSRVLRSNVSSSACFSSAPMSISPAMKSASRAGPSIACKRGHDLVRDLRQQPQNLGRALPSGRARAPRYPDRPLRVVDELHARDQERIALEELQHAKALHALANRVMRAVRRRDVAQHVGRRADPMQVVRARLLRRRACSAAGCRADAAGGRPRARRRASARVRRSAGTPFPGTARRCAPER